jgi:hypothetical protein
VISKAKGVVTGVVNYKNEILELLPSAGGNHVLYEVDTARLPQTDTVHEDVDATANDAFTAATVDYGTGGGSTQAMASGSAAVHDVLVLYTAASASRYGQATLESMIQTAVQQTNQAYLNSRANVTINVVGLQKSPVNEASGMSATLTALKNNSTVRSLVDKLAADMTILVSEDGGGCGTSGLWIMTLNNVTTVDAYAVAKSDCLSQFTFTHELGHLQRLDHNREDKVNIGMYAYSFGYRRCVTGGFRDIMSYPCSGTPRILNFSNPSVTYDGYATGVSYESDPSHSADNARTLNNTATTVAGYRVSSGSTSPAPAPTAPTAPSNLVASSVAYNAVAVHWNDNSPNESGFKLQRSTDGVNFTEIASLGAGTVAFTDSTVNASRSYYYRVSAYNSAGGSGYSNTLAVSTPAAPAVVAPSAAPAAPTSVVATNKGDGSAQVSWTDASSNETSFVVCRKAYSASTSTWSTCLKVGTVPSGITSLIDLSGNGTFQYYVRAVNAVGKSVYTGPAQVTVTGN